MAKLHSLIKYKRHALDEKRRILAELNVELERMQYQRKTLLDNLAREKNLAAVDIESARNFGAYLNRILKEQDQLNERIREKMEEVQAATVVVQDAYLEAKKFEITQERRDQMEMARLGKLEADRLDDIGLESFRRSGV